MLIPEGLGMRHLPQFWQITKELLADCLGGLGTMINCLPSPVLGTIQVMLSNQSNFRWSAYKDWFLQHQEFIKRLCYYGSVTHYPIQFLLKHACVITVFTRTLRATINLFADASSLLHYYKLWDKNAYILQLASWKLINLRSKSILQLLE